MTHQIDGEATMAILRNIFQAFRNAENPAESPPFRDSLYDNTEIAAVAAGHGRYLVFSWKCKSSFPNAAEPIFSGRLELVASRACALLPWSHDKRRVLMTVWTNYLYSGAGKETQELLYEITGGKFGKGDFLSNDQAYILRLQDSICMEVEKTKRIASLISSGRHPRIPARTTSEISAQAVAA